MAHKHYILMVCLGNICRSPLMEGIVRHKIRQRGLTEQFHIDSAGTGGWHAGEPPDRRSVAIARKYGIDISDQRARQLHACDAQFTQILCADQSNLHNLRKIHSLKNTPAAMFLEFAQTSQSDLEIPDPYYGDMQNFDQVFQLIDTHSDAVIQRLLSKL